MAISIGCQGLSRVIDELFADLKGQYVFNFLDDLVVYSSSVEAHAGQRGVKYTSTGRVYVES